jgi:hypothetical protein
MSVKLVHCPVHQLDYSFLRLSSSSFSVITINSRSDHNDADLSFILEVYIMFVNWFHNMFYYILDICRVDVHIIKVVCMFFILFHLKTREWIWNQLSTNQHTLFSYLISNRVTYLLHIYLCQNKTNKNNENIKILRYHSTKKNRLC